ncbi:hypothetical protein BsWGS_17047 [Bradybaena similaris]
MGYMTFVWQAVGLLILMLEAQGQAVEWIQRPESVSRREGENVTFVCRLSADDPSIIWVKDNAGSTSILFVKSDRFEADRRFNVINRYDLVIINVSKKDNGVYACRTKDAGIQTATLTVMLQPGPPSITRDDKGLVYTEGDVVRFTCSSTGGNPKPIITWLKNGNITSNIPEVQEDSSIGGTINSTISITMDRSDDRANYSCLVYNELNTNNKMLDGIVLSVKYAPSIAFRPYSPVYAVKVGDSTEIMCDVDANPAVNSVTWFKDGVRLAGTSTKRVFSLVSKANHGNYTCMAKNSVGERSGSLEVNVQYVPIINVPSVMTVNEGADVAVSCDIDANPAPYEVQWSKVLPGGSVHSMVNSRSLKIMGVNRTHAGNYTCRAQSQLRVSGKSVEFVSSEASVYIYVQYKPGAASIGPVSDLDIGERLDISCSASPTGFPEATYSWTKDGRPLAQNKPVLTITSVALSDNGRYNCTPTNVRGTGASAVVDVHVYEPPSIIKKAQAEISIYLTDSNLLNLTCVARGYPQPRVTWYQEGETQSLNTKMDLFTIVMTTTHLDTYSVKVESTLMFKGPARDKPAQSRQNTALQVRDMGNYSCQAESDKHSDKAITQTRLLINFPPVLEATPARLAVSKQEKAELVCSAQGHPDPSFQWFFQGQQLTSGRSGVVITQEPLGGIGRIRSRLVIMSVADRSYGLYRCLVTNVLGNVSKDLTLSMKSRPETPTNLTSPSSTWESAMLVWLPGFNGGLDQRFYIQRSGPGQEVTRIEVMPVSSSSFNVTKLRPSTTYTFQVFAENQIGSSPLSQPLTVTTNYLQIANQLKVPVFDARHRKLMVLPPSPSNDYCLRVEVRSDRLGWSPVNGCIKVLGDAIEISQTGVTAVNVSVCLSYRPDVCGTPMVAEIYSNDKETTLTEEHVIIIACVCGVIIITLLIILFCFIFRRRRNAAKAYQGGNQGDPPPYTAVPANKKPQVYDNQDNNAVDGYPNRETPSAGSVPHSPSKDKYIGLQDRAGGGDSMMDTGYNTSDPMAGAGKPKKVIYEVVV